MAVSFEEIRAAAVDILAGRERVDHHPEQFDVLLRGVGQVLERRGERVQQGHPVKPLPEDCETFREVFWDLFRQGIITLGSDNANKEFPHFCVSSFGRRILANQQLYFFHDVETYEKQIRKEVPKIDDVTLLYLKEAMQAFRVGCLLSSSVMLGVATEHTFNLLIEQIDAHPAHKATFKAVSKERFFLQQFNKFRSILESHSADLPRKIKEDLDTYFAAILAVIRYYRNQSGHPSGKLIEREEAYVLLHLFIPYCKKMYQLRDHYS